MLVELFSLLLAIRLAQSFNLGREAAPTPPFNCANVHCGPHGGLPPASSYCASLTGSIVTTTITPTYTTVPNTCGNPPVTTTTATSLSTFGPPYCLRPHPRSSACSCLSIPSSYTVTVTTTAPAMTTFTGIVEYGVDTGYLAAQKTRIAHSSIYVLAQSGYADMFLLRDDGALGDFTLVQDERDGTPPVLAYQAANPSGGGVVYFDPTQPNPPEASLVKCSISPSDCSLTCSGTGGLSSFYACDDGVELATSANATENCSGPYAARSG